MQPIHIQRVNFSMTTSALSIRYSRPLIAIHWLTLLLLVAIYASMELRGYATRGSALREGMKHWHFMLGLTVLTLVWIRLATRWFGTTPAADLRLPRWQRQLAGSVHVLLYVFMVAMPILGWLLLSAEGKSIPFFGLELPPLMGTNRAWAERFEDWHKTLANIGYFLIGAHAGAALLHHYVFKDATLRRMLP